MKFRQFFASVFLLMSISAMSLGQTFNEYQVKAVFVFNFTSFVQWPESAFESKQSPFIIAVAGENVFGSYLEEVVQGEKVNGHPIVISFAKDLKSLAKCHLVYIPKTADDWDEGDLKRLKEANVLTVSSHPSFMDKGGMIYLYNENSKIRLQINPEAATAGGLNVSSKLLRLASIYKTK